MTAPRNPAQRPCPSCGGVMQKAPGSIGEPVIGDWQRRIARPVTAYACSRCEHCEEVR